MDLSEIFSMDKIAYNARNLNYWCAFVVPLSTHTHTHTHTGRSLLSPAARTRAVQPGLRCHPRGCSVRHHGPRGHRWLRRVLCLDHGIVSRIVPQDELQPEALFQNGRRRVDGRDRPSADGMMPPAIHAHPAASTHSQRIPTCAPSPHNMPACAVIRDVLDAILRHRAHLLSEPAVGSRCPRTPHGAHGVYCVATGVSVHCPIWRGPRLGSGMRACALTVHVDELPLVSIVTKQ